MPDLEQWRPIPGYEGWYDASSLGRIRRVLACRGATAGRFLRQAAQGEYLAVTLYRNDQRRKFGVHVLVASAFHGPRPSGLIVNHKDTNKHNNRAENLEWVTYQRNAEHAAENGLHGGRPLKGEDNPRAKLTAEQAREIRELKGQVGARVLAKRFGVSRSAIQFIHQGKHWADPLEWPLDLRVRQFPEVRTC